ncbi:MAG: DUF167 domain-containing protein [Methanothrix sp.]
MDIEEAVKPHPQGCVISFEIVPGSSNLEVPSGYNPWRKSLEAHLTEEPMRGRANRQLIEELARAFGISEKDIELMSGQKSHKKKLLVRGIDSKGAVGIISQRLNQSAVRVNGGRDA